MLGWAQVRGDGQDACEAWECCESLAADVNEEASELSFQDVLQQRRIPAWRVRALPRALSRPHLPDLMENMLVLTSKTFETTLRERKVVDLPGTPHTRGICKLET